MKARLWTLFLIATLSVISCAPEPAPTPAAAVETAPPHIMPAGLETINSYLEASVADGQVPKIVAMVANLDGVIYEGRFGKKDVANDINVELNSIFNLASMTKPITSVAVMMLLEEGLIALDDPVSMYLPEWADREVVTSIGEDSYETEPANGEITIRQLLAHFSGLAYSFASPTMQSLIDVSGEFN